MGPTIVAAARTLRTDLLYRITIRLGRRPQDPVALLPEFLCSGISPAPARSAYPNGLRKRGGLCRMHRILPRSEPEKWKGTSI